MTDRAGRTPLHYAALSGDLDAVRKLLDDGADPDVVDDQGFTPLHFAAQDHHADVAATLLEAGASIDPITQFGNTPLWVATMNARGRGDLITLLLTNGADPDRDNDSGVSPRALATRIANYDLEQYFT